MCCLKFLIFLYFATLFSQSAVISRKTEDPVGTSPSAVKLSRIRRQYPWSYGNYGGYPGYGYPYGSGGYGMQYGNGMFPIGGYYPGSIVGSGSMWAAGGGLVGNILSFLVG